MRYTSRNNSSKRFLFMIIHGWPHSVTRNSERFESREVYMLEEKLIQFSVMVNGLEIIATTRDSHGSLIFEYQAFVY